MGSALKKIVQSVSQLTYKYAGPVYQIVKGYNDTDGAGVCLAKEGIFS